MGREFEVFVWKCLEDGKTYGYIAVWAGDSLIIALLKMRKLKRSGEKCVKLEWR